MKSTFIRKKNLAGRRYNVNVEIFRSAQDVVDASATREITDGRFNDMSDPEWARPDFSGVESLEEACNILKTGYQPTVEKLREVSKVTLGSQKKRVSFFADVVGYQPIVPLALMGVPGAMVNSQLKHIKQKVIDVYYDMTANCGVDKDDILKAGQKMLAAILELEAQGYRFNLYAIQTYVDSSGADILVTKVKDSNTALDLKRISFPLTHPAYFRVIGFDWYSKVPGGKYRCGYGHAFEHEFKDKEEDCIREIFGKNAVGFSCTKILKNDETYIKNKLTGNNDNGGLV